MKKLILVTAICAGLFSETSFGQDCLHETRFSPAGRARVVSLLINYLNRNHDINVHEHHDGGAHSWYGYFGEPGQSITLERVVKFEPTEPMGSFDGVQDYRTFHVALQTNVGMIDLAELATNCALTQFPDRSRMTEEDPRFAFGIDNLEAQIKAECGDLTASTNENLHVYKTRYELSYQGLSCDTVKFEGGTVIDNSRLANVGGVFLPFPGSSQVLDTREYVYMCYGKKVPYGAHQDAFSCKKTFQCLDSLIGKYHSKGAYESHTWVNALIRQVSSHVFNVSRGEYLNDRGTDNNYSTGCMMDSRDRGLLVDTYKRYLH